MVAIVPTQTTDTPTGETSTRAAPSCGPTTVPLATRSDRADDSNPPLDVLAYGFDLLVALSLRSKPVDAVPR